MKVRGWFVHAMAGLACLAAARASLKSELRLTSEWNSGLVAEIRLTNTGQDATSEWRVLLEFDGKIAHAWGARILSHEGNAYLLGSEDWNQVIAPGGHVIVGFLSREVSGGIRMIRCEGRNEKPMPSETMPPPLVRSPQGPVSTDVESTLVDGVWYHRIHVYNRTWKRLRNWQLEVKTENAAIAGASVLGRHGDTVLIGDNIMCPDIAPGGKAVVVLESPALAVREPSPQRVHALFATAGMPGNSYCEALRLSLLFYEAQRSGALPANNRIPWRGDSAMGDGADAGMDLSGGYYDAGDHMKFAFPMASAMTLLAWGGIEYGSGYKKCGEWQHLLGTVRWGTDWILRAAAQPDVFFVQVGDVPQDHSYWGPPEKMQMPRPSYNIDAGRPGSDVAGEAAASLASASILFRDEDPSYSARLLDAARTMFAFADKYRGNYSESGVASQYASHSGYLDELAWAAAWLYAATKDSIYLDRAKALYTEAVTGSLEGALFSWDDKRAGLSVLMAKLVRAPVYQEHAEQFLVSWLNGARGVRRTSGGLAWREPWGSLRYAANTAFLAGIYADLFRKGHGALDEFSRQQINYMLGDNPAQRSYLTAYGPNPPRNPHHRSSHGSSDGNITNPEFNLHVLPGALVGGPTRPDDFAFADDRRDVLSNEVALDYNAAFTGCLARMIGREKKP